VQSDIVSSVASVISKAADYNATDSFKYRSQCEMTILFVTLLAIEIYNFHL